MVVLFIIIVMIGSRSTTTLTIIYDTISAIKRAYRRNSVEGEDGSGSNEPQVVSASEVVVPNSVKKRKKHLKRQFKMISVFRYIFIGYLLGKIVVLVILMIGVDEWVGDVLYQVLDVAVAVAVGITFRLHKVKANGNYFLLENEFDDDEDGGGSYYENDDECASNDSSSKGSVELESQR